MAEERSRLQLEQTLADIDANAENYANYPGGVDALKEQMKQLAAIDLSNTIKGMDTFRMGLRDMFQGSLDSLRNDIANPDVSFGEAFTNLGKNILDGISKQYMSKASEGLANKMATALPGGDLTGKNTPQGQKGQANRANDAANQGGLPAAAGVLGGKGQAGGAGVPVTVTNVPMGGGALGAAGSAAGASGGIGGVGKAAGGGSPWGMAAVAGITVGAGLMGKKKNSGDKKLKDDREKFWQTGSQWQPGGRGTTEGNMHYPTGTTSTQGIFDPAISASQTLSQSLQQATSPLSAFALNMNLGSDAAHALHQSQIAAADRTKDNMNSLVNNTTNIKVQANDLRSFRGSADRLRAEQQQRAATSANRLS
jgi:hypothetical protein